METSFEAVVRELGGRFVTLPLSAHAPSDVVVFARHPVMGSDEVPVESISFRAARIVRPLDTLWPEATFQCDKAVYRNGEFLVYRGGEAFGYVVDPAVPIAVTEGIVKRTELTSLGTHDALTRTIPEDRITVTRFELSPQEPPAVAPSVAESREAALLAAVAPPYTRVWAPTRGQAAALIALGLVLCGFSLLDLRSGDPFFSFFGGLLGSSVILYGTLAAVLAPDQFRRTVWAIIDPAHRPPAWMTYAAATVVGLIVMALGMAIAHAAFVEGQAIQGSAIGSSLAAIVVASQGGLQGLLVMAFGAIVVGFSAIRSIPWLE